MHKISLKVLKNIQLYQVCEYWLILFVTNYHDQVMDLRDQFKPDRCLKTIQFRYGRFSHRKLGNGYFFRNQRPTISHQVMNRRIIEFESKKSLQALQFQPSFFAILCIFIAHGSQNIRGPAPRVNKRPTPYPVPLLFLFHTGPAIST